MEQEFEKPELQPEAESPAGSIALPGPGERVPMPAGPGTSRRSAGEKSSSNFGLVAAAILTAGLASAIVFKGDLRHTKPAVPALPPAAHALVKEPLSKAPPAPAAPARVTPAQLPSELPTAGTPGTPVETAAPAPDSFSSPLPFFSSEEDAAIPKASALQPYDNGAEPARQPASASPVLPAAARLIPRMQPGGGQAAASPVGTTPVSRGVCTSCKSAVSGTKTSSTLQGGPSYVQHEIGVNYVGVCDGKYVYDYTNLTSNMTIGMKIVTSGGEAWTFTLKPGEKTSIKSSTEFVGNTFESYRTSQVIN